MHFRFYYYKHSLHHNRIPCTHAMPQPQYARTLALGGMPFWRKSFSMPLAAPAPFSILLPSRAAMGLHTCRLPSPQRPCTITDKLALCPLELPLLGRRADNLFKVALQRGDRGKTYLPGQGIHGKIFLLQEITGLLDPHHIDILQGRHIHAFCKKPAEIRLADAACPGQLLDFDFLAVMQLHID